ncbi:class II 3-deoxy-7-phosphoheptulonate synthase [Streptomyces sp. WI04-05B]|uniref:class II 3-deoxy-7-phosphoheptulonate synthase n=1 Tax=Streptomyces TaxID=1883 RepID=UPI0029ABF0A0|nr:MULTISPECIES: 3-deoxy-7-phosphoheptulonate synthase class II [unclassified Streptomyces]MDX2546556.1 3-deoxy-7-phosphoheptulonate synthase class II [Streptomyces sp. WI04-05B]MDX2587812.1 3-deoxy-7-phosphoheptulonate synthase class II [Streptomyces sp. WI04-05A]
MLSLTGEAAAHWRTLVAHQRPEWPSPAELGDVVDHLAALLPLVPPEDCDVLTARLAQAAEGKAFLLQGGDCAERFDGLSTRTIHGKLRLLERMAVILTYTSAVPVVKVGRMAGQYAKPRSRPTETVDGRTLPVYRGDAVNGMGFSPAERLPDPARLLRMYDASRYTLDVMRAFARGGADPRELHKENQDFVSRSPAGERYAELSGRIGRALSAGEACGDDPSRTTELFASHEGLLLDYEAALTRRDPRSGRRYAGSGHMLWIGDRTRQLDSAHIAYFSTIDNPIAVKLGPATAPEEALALIDRLDPDRRPGRLTFIVRMGAHRVRYLLPKLVEEVTASGAPVVWVCDPMHGNTFEAPSGHKTRRFDDILAEVAGFFEVHRALGTHAGGLHVELTGEDVTECVGGGAELGFDDLHRRYESACDPRLNGGQSLDLAFLVAEMFTSATRGASHGNSSASFGA